MSGTIAPQWQTNPSAQQPGQVGAGNYTSLLNGMSPMPSMGMMPQQGQFTPPQPPHGFMPQQQPSVGQITPNLAMFGQAAQQPPGNTNYLTAILQAIHAAGGGGAPPINAANVPSPIGWNPASLASAGAPAQQAPPGITSLAQIAPPAAAPAPSSVNPQLAQALQSFVQSGGGDGSGQ